MLPGTIRLSTLMSVLRRTSCQVPMHDTVLVQERHPRRNLLGSGQNGAHVGQRISGPALPEQAPVHSLLHAMHAYSMSRSLTRRQSAYR